MLRVECNLGSELVGLIGDGDESSLVNFPDHKMCRCYGQIVSSTTER